MPTGIIVPFERSPTGDFATGSDAELAISKVIQVLGTQPGELDWRPDFGCNLRGLRHQNNTLMLHAMAEERIKDAFADWLPSLVLKSISFAMKGRRLRCTISFNGRTSSVAPRFPKDLDTEIEVELGSGAAT